MIYLSFYEFIKNIKRNILLAVIVSIMAVVVAAVWSVLKYERNMLAPFKEFDAVEGTVVFASDSGLELGVNENDIISTYSGQIVTGSDMYGLYTVPEWISSIWEPRLSIGRFETAPAEDGSIPVVAGGKKNKFKIGDEVCFDVKGKMVRLLVTGMLEEETLIMGAGDYYEKGKLDYRSFYGVPDEDVYFLAAYEPVLDNRIEIYENSYKIIRGNTDIYEDIQLATSNTCMKLSDFMEESHRNYKRKIMTYVPIVVIGSVIVIICSLASVYVSFMYSQRRYAVFYLVGSTQGQRLLVNMGNIIGTTVISVILSMGLLKLVQIRTSGLVSGVFVLITGFYILFVLLMIFITVYVMKNKSPKEQLTRGGV